MKKSFVREWMTTVVTIINPDTKLTEAHEIMKAENIRRLPVLKANKLVGIVTIGDIREALPSDATSLTMHEINYLLSKVTVKDIMTRHVLTAKPDTSMQEVALSLLNNKIGGLPVLDDDQQLVGIITESDIFRIVAAEPVE